MLAHEFGHLLGLDDVDADELMAGEVSPELWQSPALSIPGVRRLDLTDLTWDPAAVLLSREPLRGTERGGEGAGESRSPAAELTSRQASDAALRAWAEDDGEHWVALRRDDEYEYSQRIDHMFRASGDWTSLRWRGRRKSGREAVSVTSRRALRWQAAGETDRSSSPRLHRPQPGRWA